jgi:2'-5' RNA ligase
MIRLFIGIAIDENARDRCAEVAERLRMRAAKLRFVEPKNYHMTVAFLGNVEAGRLAVVKIALAAVASRHERFTATLNRVGVFPHERKPRIVFVGSRGTHRAYRALAADVCGECARLGFAAAEKDHIPHVTIARAPERKRVTLPMLEVAPFAAAVGALTLFESVPHDGKTRYVVRAESPLAAG